MTLRGDLSPRGCGRMGVFCVSESEADEANGDVGSSVAEGDMAGEGSLPKKESSGLKRGVVKGGLRAGKE